ncbi:MAG: TrkH family potassium uptake protein [Burkholderiales bacterium]|nr:Trk system potassium uptake protein TrkH [Rhodocyclaceae bacterium]MCQ3923506.1 TrkH family potassium uptake protein [Rhodocyclaceae bacterium]MCZ2421490.1 TrkH family potassium uptake protein [Burkholderiales bacterium]HNQ56385.1 potassium transporter TrkG [Candidatus Desulfobacillus denitrificans]HNT62471.1 potassium transporter TrkG [Candidatus Desulfobacillus denitrificans]
MSNPLAVIRVFALVLLVFALTMLVPMIVAWAGRDAAVTAFQSGFVATFLSAALLWLLTRRHVDELRVRDGYLLVSLVWVGMPAFATIPLMLYLPQMSFTDAYFETVSGLTTTGATVIEGLDTLPFSINLWRTGLVFLGGMGLIVLVVAILPLLGVGGRQLFSAESPGPLKDTKLTPRMAQTAKGLWLVYLALAVLCTLGYVWAGMGWGDAVMHMFSTLGLGGFSSHDASYAHFNSPAVEAVAIVFMTLAGMNFATHYMAIRRRDLAFYWIDPEIRWYVGVLYASVLGIAAYLWWTGTYPDFATALRFAAFNTVSIATTTGFANTDYAQWPFLAPMWMLFLCSFVTCAGSTGGGIKMMRAIIVFRQVMREVVRIVHPSAVRTVKLAEAPLPNKIVFAVLAFSFAYMAIIVSLTLLMVFSGLDVVTGFSAVVASFNNTGPGLGEVGPSTTFKSLSDFQTWVCTAAMLLGRLEIFTLLVVLSPAFWRK